MGLFDPIRVTLWWDYSYTLVDGVADGAALVSGIVGLWWIYVAARNADAIDDTIMQTTPAWAVGWFFVPILGLWKPYGAMKQIWLASQADSVNDPKASPILLIWWICFIFARIFEGVQRNAVRDDVQSIFRQPLWIALGLSVLSGIFFILIVKRTDQFQSQRPSEKIGVF
ncbi:hypothetical protein Astex_3455 [Asticcacaulis excentricus CB 48]|uniref:DUF4328 domain-containing protein n=1 Tax=Asticcacaulis excentricus (strain ATCC 15261 / DSM 4724 / KCTC 12464 / NCIMB 9791 / VKM B-1370 / CB 48) TaxID=573065 RepID=E8RUB6_ASTEC|nr:hypothetical protein Astex_3455 [Asticcacaulis excentricus CB 48]